MKYSLMLALFVLVHFSMAAQALSIKGTVRDAETGEPLLGVTVQERNSSNYGISDAQGEYAIEVSRPDAVLRFAYLGYSTREVEVAARTTIDVALLPAITALDEVVVTALGLERSYRDLGYAVQSLDGQAVSEVKSANFVDGYLSTGPAAYGLNGSDEIAQIIRQKWLANIINGYEGWIEWRRTGWPELLPVAASLNNGLIPVRMPYPSSEAALNPVGFESAAAATQGNSINAPVWWDMD